MGVLSNRRRHVGGRRYHTNIGFRHSNSRYVASTGVGGIVPNWASSEVGSIIPIWGSWALGGVSPNWVVVNVG